MNERRATASEVIKSLEARLSHASELADDVFRLLDQIAEIEVDAKEYATRSLGNDHGASAFDLALFSCPSLKRLRQQGGHFAAASSESIEDRPVVNSSHSAPIVEATTNRTSASVTLHGVEVPLSRIEEAKVIVDEAIAHKRNGGTINLYANNRGKNAWRRSLFKASMDAKHHVPEQIAIVQNAPIHLIEETARVPAASIASPAIQIEQLPPSAPKREPAPIVAPAWDLDPLDDPIDTDALGRSIGSENEPNDIPSENQRPAFRRPSYGNSSPKPDGLAEAIKSMRENGKDPSVPSTPSASIRFKQPHFLRRGRTT